MMGNIRMDEAGIGVAAARARRRKLVWTLAALMGAGAVVGFFSALLEVEGGGFLEGIPPAWAIAASIITVLAMTIGSWRYNMAMDELERRDGMWSSAVALNLFFVGYAVWYLWWKGGLAPEPDHEVIAVATFASAMLAYLYKKLRP